MPNRAASRGVSRRFTVTVVHALTWAGAAQETAVRSLPSWWCQNRSLQNSPAKAGVTAPALKSFIADLDAGRRKRVMDEDMFVEERELGAQHGIFTLAVGWKTADKAAHTPNDENFEAFVNAVMPGELDKAETEVGDSKVRQGRCAT